ncbi:SDR family NAD(P)-dependent oxidoreductase [uncultured Endozoicomonas sp.]|uniref:SDR family NAD(P)-dependent oxidoreductase n=1 Tax=uncultured Endozoicomonas sp. TaxID=432652 RepID=UPI00262CCA48|nr:SDR family NAD(P)-dependent oxidoreductase [uncultured Endozoicomonas sp.]
MTQDHKTKPVVVWITGASQGIGEALALAMAKQGMTVLASARNHEHLANLVDKSKNLPGQILAYPLDITDQSVVNGIVEKMMEDHGRIDQAILNAGTYIPIPAESFNSHDVRQQVELNIMGTSYCIEALLPDMIQRGQGLIAINASLAGYRGLPKAAGYGATKAALINMAESLHSELSDHGIHFKVINPGFVKTPLTDKNTFPMPFLIDSDEAASIIIKGLASKRFEIRFPRIFAAIMGTLRHLPYALYFPIARKVR